MKACRRRVCALIFSLFAVFCSFLDAQSGPSNSWDIAVLDRILANVPYGQRLAQVGDMQIQTSLLKVWRNQLAGIPPTGLAFDGVAPKWTAGNIYYAFTNDIPPERQKAFADAAAEWATFANLHFIPRTTQSNYVLVIENPSLGGGQSALGMVGGQQLLQLGPSAWNRGTIVHELGHTLGVIHEHQRSDRDSYLTILTNNILPGLEANFVKLGNSQNQGSFDFLSIMEYSRNTFSTDPDHLNTIEPLPAYSQYLDLLGAGDPVLTPSDRAGVAAVYSPGPALTSVVTNTQDSGPGSLRAAIYFGFDNPGTTITFNIPTNDPGFASNVFTIRVTDQLPGLSRATVINAATEPFQLNTNGPAIQLNGALTVTPSTFAHGFHFRGTNCGVRGFIINGFPGDAILMDGSNTTGNFVSGCYLGIDPSGTLPVPNGIVPVNIVGGASGNRIGGTNAADRNIISGSTYQGIAIRDNSNSNLVQGNYIGLNAAGTAALPNGYSGIILGEGSRGNIIGGTVPGARNVISGNTFQGVALGGLGPAHSNTIAGNYIGINAAGTAAVPNGFAGVEVFNGGTGNVIGGTTPGAGNVLSGNLGQGILIGSPGTDGNIVLGNLVGLDATGITAIPNGLAGVEIYFAAQANTIGGSVPGARNIISGNSRQGIAIHNAAGNLVAGNYVGLNLAGNPVPNAWAGVNFFDAATGNRVGGITAAERNVISGNGIQGVLIQYPGTDNNVVLGNYIGTAVSGLTASPNQASGIEITGGAQNNIIGGNVPGAGNVISGNASQGIVISLSNTLNNVIQGNFIGLNATGLAALANGWSGIEIYNANSNVVGGGAGTRNFVSGNGNYGVLMTTGSTANLVKGNTIGLDAANTSPVPNTWDGISLGSGAQSNQIGGVTTGAANIIAGNGLRGIALFDSATTGNSIRGNSIFGNSGGGIALFSGGNHSQAAPTLLSATVSNKTTVAGSFFSAGATAFHFDFYASPGPPSNAQAMTYLGVIEIQTGTGGTASISNSLPVIVPPGFIITATATDPAGNTSPLSGGATVTTTDSVGDGIPNAWRAAHFGGPGNTTNSQSCATCDADGDGMNTYQEFLAGTNPTNAASVLRLTAPSFSGTNVVLNLSPVRDFIYRIQSRDDLTNGFWSILADQVIGPGGPLQIIDPGAASLPKRFYRVQVFPQ